MNYSGNILKMESRIINGVVNYTLSVGSAFINMNKLIGQNLYFSYSGQINCIYCGRKTKKSYAQGYCYPCMVSLPQTDQCIMRPELCKAHLGISRDMEWSKSHCLSNHFVYLAVSSGLKVGVTRESQIPTRWIDQGAVKGIILAKTPNRNTAGRIEVFLKNFLADKTDWRKMLTNNINTSINLITEKSKVKELLKKEFKEFIYNDDTVYKINYPVNKYPDKITSISLDKLPEFEKKLIGIKGQYLIFDDNTAINIRKHNGYYIIMNNN